MCAVMSRWHDRSPGGLARWGNLSPEDRFADRVADLLLAVEDLRDILDERPSLAVGPLAGLDIAAMLGDVQRVAVAFSERLPAPALPPSRDPELAHVLCETDHRLRRLRHVHGIARDVVLAAVERYVAPYALALFHEIRRLDAMNGGPPPTAAQADPTQEEHSRAPHSRQAGNLQRS